MSTNDSPAASIGSLGQRARRGSLASLSGTNAVDKEQLSQALDKIHNSASNSDTLTTFNEFASPPPPSSTESKGIAGDLMQNGLSGLYSRFRGAVGAGPAKEKPSLMPSKTDLESVDSLSIKSQGSTTPGSKASILPTRTDTGVNSSPVQLSSASSRLQSPTSSSFAGHSSEAQSQAHRSSKASYVSTAATTPGTSKTISTRPSITPMTKATTSMAVVPTLAPVNISAFKDGERGRQVGETRNTEIKILHTIPAQGDTRHSRHSNEAELDSNDSDDDQSATMQTLQNVQSRDSLGVDGSIDLRKRIIASNNSASSALSSLQKRPAGIDRITQSHLPGYQASRASSTDRSIAETSPINTSAHNSVRHESFSIDDVQQSGPLRRLRIPGTTINEGAPEAVSARLEQMRKQVLSKEFWMADEICKECFLCGDTFSAFRRKHHCRTCGCIFDNKCTSIISGQRFGVQGSLRVCKTCLDIINRRHDSSGSDDSADEGTLPSFFQTQQAKYENATKTDTGDASGLTAEDTSATSDVNRPLATPMMAIPATRRIGDSSNRRSAILEIDAPQLSRPSSSRSLKALSAAGRPPSSGHKRHISKHNLFGRFKPTVEERAPFHRGPTEDLGKKSRLPAFHDDNIIDPDLAPYMSDEESSGDEQMSIFATMNSVNTLSHSFENDRSGFGSLLSSSKKQRARGADKSVSGISFTSRGAEESNAGGFPRSSRRRNLSAASTSMHHTRSSRQIPQSFGNLDEEASQIESSSIASAVPPSRMTRSASMRDAKAPQIELNSASLHHVRRLLRQLLQDANIPNLSSWEKALIPILLQCTDDVNPNVRLGDDIDIRHYVKLKKIPGGKPGDTSYVSGVVFTKNVALKSMPRSISNPRIVIVSFPIEYSRHQHHFMSLEPVIAQEKEFLRNMVNRIASLRPQVLLVQKHISGLALQYLSEAGIAVAYNVKQSVIEAVSRCAQTEIISSIDMVVLKPVHIGKSAGFDVKTYVHSDIPGKKKTYIYLSGCPKELGCTIALRGANMEILTKMKRITEFMVYVVYNLKLETCLMRDEFVLVPSVEENSGSLSFEKQHSSNALRSGGPDPATIPQDAVGATSNTLHTVSQAADKMKQGVLDVSGTQDQTANPSSSTVGVEHTQDGTTNNLPEPPKIYSAHEAHSHVVQEDQVPEDIPMPTFYSDMVAKHQTKILSASPFVKFMQPYLLMRAREQERRLIYLKRLRDQDTFEEQTETEKSEPQKFQLIKPEMVHETLSKAPRAIMEVLHAVHDAEYDKALHNYLTQKRQWENYIQGNLNLFDPYAHQNITVLYTVVCTSTSIPCAGPELLALVFYNEHSDFDGDCTLGQYVEDLCMGAGTVCTSNGCEKKMSEHHRTYVHGEARVTVFVEKSPCKIKGLQDSILMWSYCKICQKETQVMPMSESTWKYSLGKYLELSFWSSDLRLRSGFCPHNLHRDHLRYFGFRNTAIRIHYDPIDLLEIVVPRTRITWKVENDLRLKNEIFTKIEERWNRFMATVHSRLNGINIESVAPEKVEACKAEVEALKKRAQDEHVALTEKLQQKYMESKYYEIVPMNRAVRAMQERVAEWDGAFADFDSNFFPSEKDIRRLAALQLKKMFMDRDESTSSLVSTETTDHNSDMDEKSPSTSMELTRHPSNATTEEARDALNSVMEEDLQPSLPSEEPVAEDVPEMPISHVQDEDHERMNHLDLAVSSNVESETPTPVNSNVDPFLSVESTESEDAFHSPTSPLESTLSEKVERLRKAHRKSTDQGSGTSESSSIPRPAERGAVRRSGTAISPPMSRTQSQPSGTLRRNPSSKLNFSKGEPRMVAEASSSNLEGLKSSATEPTKPTDKKLSERLGLGTLKRKSGHSLIPRSVHGKKKESKVSTLAKHFEQLSREFEKERLKDRRQRAAKVTQSRAFPKASSKPIVEVYKDVNEAVEERSPTNEELHAIEPTHQHAEPSSVVSGLANLNTERTHVEAGPNSPADTNATAEDTATEAEMDDHPHNVSQNGSDDDGAASDNDHPLLDALIPGAAEIAESIEKPEGDMPLELPKHEKTSLMKMLTNFWAERSASGWTPLEYPINAGDHIFADEDVIVREDEPSSLIAFTLQSQHYRATLEEIRSQGKLNTRREESSAGEDATPSSIHEEDRIDEAEVETSLLRATGTHLAYSFVDGNAKMQCKIFFAEQFDAVRRKCGVSDRIVESLSRCLKWDSKGGKTKSVFLKTLDDRLILKALSPIETAAFLKFAPAYFNIMAEALFHDLPTVIAKMLGFYQIIIKNPTTGTEIKWDVLVMENLFYDRSPTRIFDLKGSMRNRKIQSTGEQNEVLLDENMVEFIYESPLFAREVCCFRIYFLSKLANFFEHSKKLLRAAIFNDTLFLQRNDVMDYSLMVAVDEVRSTSPLLGQS